MELKDLLNMKDDLTNKKNEMLKKKTQAGERARIAEASQIDSKIPFTIIYSALTYILLVVGGLAVRGIFGISGIMFNIPKICVVPLFLIPSFALGTYIEKKFEKSKNLDGRLSQFSNAETEEEKLEEQIRYEIENNKFASRVNVIEKTLNDIEVKEKFVSNNGDLYTLGENNNIEESKVEEEISGLSTVLENKFQELDVLSAQNLLAKRFVDERVEGCKKQTLITYAASHALLAMLYVTLPFVALGIEFSGIAGLATMFGILGVSATVFGGYHHKRSKLKESVFNKLNAELGENALAETTPDFQDMSEIKSKKEEKIKETSMVLTLLEERKVLLENIKNKNELEELFSQEKNLPQPTYGVDNKYSTFCKVDDLRNIVCSTGEQLSVKDSCYIPVRELYPDEMDDMGSCDNDGPSLVKKK